MKNEESEPVSKVDIVVYALAMLKGAERTVHSEEIAAKCFELSRTQFSWRLPAYRDKWPDKYIVKTALEDAKKKVYGALVRGTYALDLSKDGWSLTPAGAEWARKHGDRIRKGLKQKTPGLPKLDVDRFRKKLKADTCFKYFERTGSLDGVSHYMFTDMLGCSPDAPTNIVRRRFDQLLATAKLASDSELSSFLEACADSFSDLLMVE